MKMLHMRILAAAALLLWTEAAEFYQLVGNSPVTLESDPTRGCDPSPTAGMDCPEGWSLKRDAEGAVCLWLSNSTSSRYDANDTCVDMGGNLLSIRSRARQGTVRDFLKGLNDVVWTGGYKHFDSSNYTWPDGDIVEYTNLKDGFQYDSSPWITFCLVLQEDVERTWLEVADLDTPRYFVCDMQTECNLNRAGPTCDGECHCLGELCQGGQPCSGGCEAGWTGPQCCQRKEQADVAYYCVNAHGQTFMRLRVDPKAIRYEALMPIDEQGQQLDWCHPILVTRDGQDYSYTIKVPVIDRVRHSQPEDQPQKECGRKKSGNNTYTWRLSLQEKEGLHLPFDRTLITTCDFNNAETMSRGIEYVIQPENERALDPVESLDPTGEDVTLEVIDYTTGDVIHQAALGTTVKLRMHLNGSGGVTARGVSPYRCKAKGPGGKPMRHLTDWDGCARSSSPVSSLRGSNGTVTSKGFQLFAFPGQDTVTISCSFSFCFTESEQPMCDDRCTHERSRGKRSADAKPGSLSTTIHILPAKGSSAVPRSELSDSSSDLHTSNALMPVTCLVVALILGKSAMLS